MNEIRFLQFFPLSKALATKERIIGLDAARVGAIFFVVLHHILFISSYPKWIYPIGFLGSLGVDVFLVLSGYFLGDNLLEALRGGRFCSGKHLSYIFINRWLRILPPYYLYLFVSVIVFPPFYSQLFQSFQYLFFMQNFAWKMPNLYFQSWTLAIIECFQILFILSLFFCYKLTRQKRLSFIICLFIFGLAPLLLKALCLPLLNASDFDTVLRRMVICRLDAPAVGVLMILVQREWPKIWESLLRYSWFAIIFFMLIIAYHLASYPLLFSSHWSEISFYPLVEISIALMLPLLCNWKGNTFSVLGKGIRFISKISYSIYVSHIVAMAPIFYLFSRMAPGWKNNYLEVMPLYFGGVLLLAYLTYLLVEVPYINFRIKWKTKAKLSLGSLEPTL